MLTRELLNYTRRNGRIYPAFAAPGGAAELECAARMLAVYDSAESSHLSRGEISDMLAAEGRGGSGRAAKFRDGLLKILDDDAVFTVAEELDYPDLRRRLFTASAAALTSAAGDFDCYRRLVTASAGDAAGTADIYGDLPDCGILSSRKHHYTPEELLRRYDLVLVQSLLLYADELQITLPDDDPAILRRLMRLVRFYRLLAVGTRLPESNGIRLVISGPFALFGAARKYALQLAGFFPAVVNVPGWRLEAQLRIGNTTGRLRLDHTCGLRSPHRNFADFVPEEIRIFGKIFRQKDPEWEPVAEVPLLHGGGGSFSVPDFSFRHRGDGRVFHLELFHRWHRGGLEERLRYLREHPEVPLLLGVERSAASAEELAEWCGGDAALAARCFLFRDFPGVDTVIRALNSTPAKG